MSFYNPFFDKCLSHSLLTATVFCSSSQQILNKQLETFVPAFSALLSGSRVSQIGVPSLVLHKAALMWSPRFPCDHHQWCILSSLILQHHCTEVATPSFLKCHILLIMWHHLLCRPSFPPAPPLSLLPALSASTWSLQVGVLQAWSMVPLSFSPALFQGDFIWFHTWKNIHGWEQNKGIFRHIKTEKACLSLAPVLCHGLHWPSGGAYQLLRIAFLMHKTKYIGLHSIEI